MAAALRIGIVGAGTAGLYLAVLLQRAGHRVSLFEKAPSARSAGCGILLVKAGVEAIAASGLPHLVEALVAAGQPVQRYVFRNLKGGEIERHAVEREPDEWPALLIHRSAILEALWNVFDPADFQPLCELVDLEQQADGVRARFADGRHWNGDLLVSADGLYSRLAPLVQPQRRLNYLGDRVWRGVLHDEHFCTDGDFFVYARGRGIYANFFDLGPDARGRSRTHWGFFNEEPLPSDRGERRRLLEEPIPAEALAKLPADAAGVIATTAPEAVVAGYTHDIDPLPHLVVERVALIGDAAHAMSSSQARGMTAGFEDAEALARQLEAHPGDWRGALSAFEAERLPVVHRYQANSREVSNRTGRSRPRRVSTRGTAASEPPP
ncbi:NAD(P)/FAD-dependent oxidoreductase [Cyanobium sp. Morenito 9A2]|uniref:FAD-dependent oxidoreductase n=1 Tax=Cyanobium sp. Morenito 9A2 TaxID=2823718 RepID=UPI0020CF48F3|nr:NAD(P)/FAD-dependent oxidoreductase [Cyanobium sp. Morenito 9A2]MCP9848754.1 FAD-dependent monooxygenase [Cyanobium sp. Morenito 9A2]